MCEFSTVDGFVELAESLAEMIKLAANEPSVGLFYIQQHTQNAVPNLVNLQNNVVEKSREITLHTEDLEDSIAMVRSMRECGFPIANEMIRDIKNSLSVISTKQPKRGSIKSPSWGQAMWTRNTGYRRGNGDSSAGNSGYFSNVFRSAKPKATSFKRLEHDFSESNQTEGKNTSSYPNSTSSVAATSNSSRSETEAEESPLPSQIAGDSLEGLCIDKSLSSHELLSLSENYEEFKAHREAKLEEWLGED